MIAHTALYEKATSGSYTMNTRVDIYRNGVLAYGDVPVVSGEVTCDREAKTRWSAKVEIALYPWELMEQIDNTQSRFKVWRGITSLGYTEMLQLGEYRIDKIGRSAQGLIQLEGSGLESYIIDARFLVPRKPPYGTSTVATIAALINEVVPDPNPVVNRNTYNRVVTATSVWDRDRIDAVLALGDSIGADVYADNEGIFNIEDNPTLTVGTVPVMTIAGGSGGVLLGRDSGDTRDKVYNAVSVTGQAPGEPGTEPKPIFGLAYDNDPESKTYFYGGFGQKPRFYTSQFLSTVEQCNTLAASILKQALAANRSLSFTTPAICFLEAGDVVAVTNPDTQITANYMLQSVSIGLGPDGTLDADTYVVREELAET